MTETRLSARSPLTVETKHETTYCIPLWLRDQQIRWAIEHVTGRIEAHKDKRGEPIAVVGFGPSLRQTWEQIRDFNYIITSSGAHKFLLERGITPTWHVEVDPRPHKVELLGTPHPDVVYLPASTCHPDYFRHLQKPGAQIKLWHVFSNEEDALRTLPRDEWAITGGPDVGMRAMVLARFFGFTDLHVFGIDGCAGPEHASHAALHPNAPRTYAPCEYEGKTYSTTVALLECAKAMRHEVDMLKDVKTTFYGEGLVQAMMRDYVPAPPKNAVLAITKPALISAEKLVLERRLPQANPFYGISDEKHVGTVLKLADSLKTKNILSYGSGKGLLARGIPWQIAEYDPAIPGKEELPKPADLVCCLDVLEHIEPDKILLVLDDLRRCVKQGGYFTIHTGPAVKHYADGRNTHLLQRPRPWWEKMLGKFFTVAKVFQVGPELHVVVGPKRAKALERRSVQLSAAAVDV